MKKILFALSLCLTASFTLASCRPADNFQADESVTETAAVSETLPVTSALPVTTEKKKEAENQKEKIYPVIPISEDDLPSMDGSTSAIPLEAGIRSRLLGLHYKLAREQVHHNKTHISFRNLLDGNTDLIFSVPLSEAQKEEAEAEGIHLNLVPVAREAFVFIVNKDNPVDSLTAEQIRAIYSGIYTNWAQVGGLDEEIIPYQRNEDSGSQNYMNDFMDGYELMKPPSEYTILEMGSLADHIATYDNAKNAIGYSVYTYAAQMYENSDQIKFVAVDGVVPSKETLADGSYPLLSNTYIIHRDNPSEKTEKLIKWITSEDGQQCVLDNGYLPLKDMEFPEYLKAYRAKGTGPEAPADYVPSSKFSAAQYEFSAENPENLRFIKNEKLRSLVYDDIMDRLGTPGKAALYKIHMEADNGFATFYPEGNEDINTFWTLTYDLENGKRIDRYSDLFWKGTDFVPYINDAVSGLFDDNKYGIYQLDTDFLGVTGTMEKFTVNSVIFERRVPYFHKFSIVKLDDEYDNFSPSCRKVMRTGKYYDLNDALDGNKVKITESSIPEWSYKIRDVNELWVGQYITGSVYHTDEEIKERNRLYTRLNNMVAEKIEHNSDKKARIYIDDPCTSPYNTLSSVTHEYELNLLSVTYSFTDYLEFYPEEYIGYDRETGEGVTLADVFGPEFEGVLPPRESSTFRYQLSAEPDSSDYVSYKDNSGNEVKKEIVREHVNFRYFTLNDISVKAYPVTEGIEKAFITSNHGYPIYAFSSDCALNRFRFNFGTKDVINEINRETKVTVSGRCFNDYFRLYECSDAETGEYIGWVSENDMALYWDY